MQRIELCEIKHGPAVAIAACLIFLWQSTYCSRCYLSTPQAITAAGSRHNI